MNRRLRPQTRYILPPLKSRNPLSSEQPFGIRAAERLDHLLSISRFTESVNLALASFAAARYALDSGNRSGRGLVERSPWTARDALVPLPEAEAGAPAPPSASNCIGLSQGNIHRPAFTGPASVTLHGLPCPARPSDSRGVGLQACHAGIRTGILPDKPVGRAILPADALSSASKPAEQPARRDDCLPHECQSCFMTTP